MSSIVKKMASVLLLVPIMMLGLAFVGVGTESAVAKKCGTEYKGCYVDNGNNSYTYYDKNGSSVNRNTYCSDATLGLGAGIECAHGEDQPSELFGDGGLVTTIINVMLFVIGILCVVMIIFGGIRYTTSTGDKGRVDSAKNTIIYAVVGLVVAIIAYALVNWVFVALQ